MKYHVKTRKFEGPLDLLLELIEKEKLEITDVSLAHVTDQFLGYIKEDADINPVHLADFLVIAAKLLYIKSKILLPQVEESTEEELSTDELAFRLKEYKKFKRAAEHIGVLLNRKTVLISREPVKDMQQFFMPGKNLTKKSLLYSIHQLFSLFESQTKREEQSIQETVSIAEKITSIEQFLAKKSECNFDEMLKTSSDRTEVVVTFLALLELIKQRSVVVKQNTLFDTIMVKQYE
ncbi:segregation/condensation protein A [Patescibacteria group bacterium]|nr:segregation/condensation protein A [Patescibacteria group bacterium]